MINKGCSWWVWQRVCPPGGYLSPPPSPFPPGEGSCDSPGKCPTRKREKRGVVRSPSGTTQQRPSLSFPLSSPSLLSYISLSHIAFLPFPYIVFANVCRARRFIPMKISLHNGSRGPSDGLRWGKGQPVSSSPPDY